MQHLLVITGLEASAVHGIQLEITVKDAVPSPVDMVFTAVIAVNDEVVVVRLILSRIYDWAFGPQVLKDQCVPLVIIIVVPYQACGIGIIAKFFQTVKLVAIPRFAAGDGIVHFAGLSAVANKCGDCLALIVIIHPFLIGIKHQIPFHGFFLQGVNHEM